MDEYSAKILRELLPVEKEVPEPAKSERTSAVAHWTAPILLERAAYLGKLAKYSDGSASDTLKDCPQHCVMLVFLGRSGAVEVQMDMACVYFVLDGSAALVTGESLTGELAGAREGAMRQQLRKGDVVHVPAGQPHQILLTGEKTLTCLVVKLRESPE